ncbi:MAG TPA: putative addiction module antidote protein [Cyanobacteria bacterium UBA11166]|nr:putative addiction module antidote protein [Cyanobacteria bacterium UBA11166]
MKLKDMSESLDYELKDPEYAALYLNDALHEGSPEEFLLALRNIMRVTQGMSQITTETELGRENLYKAVFESGNPHFATVYKIISTLGFQISIQPSISDSYKLEEIL